MEPHRYEVIFDCGDGIGMMPIEAKDSADAWKVADQEFLGCKFVVIDPEDYRPLSRRR
jgi:hypothetical protein